MAQTSAVTSVNCRDKGRAMKKLVLLLGLVLCPLTAQAQHPCDIDAPTSDTVLEGQITFAWCHTSRDTNGVDTAITGWTLYVNDAPMTLVAVTTDGVRNASGEMLFRATVAFIRGNYTLGLAAYNDMGEGLRTAPFALGVVGPVDVPRAVPMAPRAFRRV